MSPSQFAQIRVPPRKGIFALFRFVEKLVEKFVDNSLEIVENWHKSVLRNVEIGRIVFLLKID